MTIEVHPIGLACNLACTYCYQENMRPNDQPYLNLRKMLRQIKKQRSEFVVFGGEPLLTPIKTLELIFAFGHRYYGKNGVQTNGTLITDRHIEMFKKYNVHVGFSMDGPGRLNDAREHRRNLMATQSATAISEKNLIRCLEQGVQCSMILTLHRLNAGPERLEELAAWLEILAGKGLRSARLHLMELDNLDKTHKLVLTAEENATAVLRLTAVPGLQTDMLNEMRRNLLGDHENSSCVWNGCDPYTTPAVQGIDSDGSMSNCGRVNKGGVNYRKADEHGNERLIALYNTPYEEGGCKDCRFFLACRGQCPGTGIDGDWRNRTTHCPSLLILFEHLEKDILSVGLVPLSRNPKRKEYEQNVLKGHTGTHADWHEDWHADVPHGDSGKVWLVPVGRPE